MKVIFLDFDGVLNSNIYFIDSKMKPPFFLEDEKMVLLKRIIDETGAKIVLSTSWREVWDSELNVSQQLKEYFASFEIDVYSKTECIEYNRVLEIKDWLNHHKVSQFCILDDITGPWDDLIDHVVITNIDRNGLNERNVEEAIYILKSK